MIQLAVMAAVAVWFSLSARQLNQNAFLWAAIGVGSYYAFSYVGIWLLRAFYSGSISSRSGMMSYIALTYVVVAIALVCVFLVRRELISRAMSRQNIEDRE